MANIAENGAPNKSAPGDFPNIPIELKALDQWVVWRRGRTPKGEWTKVPYSVKTGGKASSTNPRTWAGWNDALEALEGGEWSGLGFMFSEYDPYSGVDLDHVRDAETGEILYPWAREILEDLRGGYVEVSPSGTGVHIIVRGEVPKGGSKAGPDAGTKVEAYQRARYFTVTGEGEKIPQIADGQAGLSKVYRTYLERPETVQAPPVSASNGGAVAGERTDQEVLERALDASNGAKLARLMAGDLSDYGGDHSDADHGFVGLLWFWTQDPAQIKRLHAQSGLARKKSARPDYLDRSISKIQSAGGEVYDWTPPVKIRAGVGGGISGEASTNGTGPAPRSAFQRAPLGDMIRDGVPPPEELVPEVLLKGKVHSIYSAGGTGKTFHMLYLVAQVLKDGGSVLILDLENGPRIIAERLDLLGVSPEETERLHYFPFPSVPLEQEIIEEWETLLANVTPDLVVFDSWVNCLAACGLDENSSTDIAKWADAYSQKARSQGVAVLILDHVPKEGSTARGSGRKLDYVDVQWELKNPMPFNRYRVGRIILALRKDREGWLPSKKIYSVGGTEDGGFVFGPGEPYADVTGPVLSGKGKAILQALRDLGGEGATATEWEKAAIDKSGCARSTFHLNKKEILAHAYVEEVDGRYFPTTDGEVAV